MSLRSIACRSLGVCAVTAAFVGGAPLTASAAASGTPNTTCNAPLLTKAYHEFLDENWYAPLPGVSWDSFSSPGWTLSGGAKLISATLADRTHGTVLDLPSGASAVSPQMCVSNSYPTFRGEIVDVKGNTGVAASVAYLGTKGWGPAQSFGTLKGSATAWTIPGALSIKPSTVSGWQYGRFTFVAGGSSSEYELSNLYADPRML